MTVVTFVIRIMKYITNRGQISIDVGVTAITEDSKISSVKYKNVLKTHINLCYCLLLYPFSVVTTRTGHYEFRTHCLQKALCVCLHVSVFIFSFMYFRMFTQFAIDETPEAMFFIAEGCSEILRCFSFLSILWFKKKLFIEALPKFYRQLNSVGVIGICVLHALIAIRAIASVIMFDMLRIHAPTNSETSVFDNIIVDVKFILLLGRNRQEGCTAERNSVEYIFLAILYVTLVCSKEMLTQSADSLFWVTSLVTLTSCRKLRLTIADTKTSKDEAVRCYEETRSLLDSINSITSCYILVKFLSLVPFYSADGFNVFTDNNSWSERIFFISYVVTSFAPFFLCAEAHHIARGIACPGDSGPLKLIEGFRFFTITYGFLGSICVVTITYAILVLQFTISRAC